MACEYVALWAWVSWQAGPIRITVEGVSCLDRARDLVRKWRAHSATLFDTKEAPPPGNYNRGCWIWSDDDLDTPSSHAAERRDIAEEQHNRDTEGT